MGGENSLLLAHTRRQRCHNRYPNDKCIVRFAYENILFLLKLERERWSTVTGDPLLLYSSTIVRVRWPRFGSIKIHTDYLQRWFRFVRGMMVVGRLGATLIASAYFLHERPSDIQDTCGRMPCDIIRTHDSQGITTGMAIGPCETSNQGRN